MKSNSSTKNKITVLLSGFLLLTSQAATAALPSAFQANYSVSKGSMSLGNLHTTLKYSGNKYAYHKFTKATGLAAMLTGIKITENSDGIISGHNIKPTTYLQNKAKRSSAKVEKIQFANNRATGNYRGKAFNLAISPNSLDSGAMELSLARDLSVNKTRLIYNLISKGGRLQYTFQRLGAEKINTPAGSFNTIKVKRVRKGSDRETVFWMAKEIGYMPVKIHHREGNSVITSVMRNYKKL